MRKQKQDIFDLNSTEERVFAFLASEPDSSLAHVAWHIKIPRTTTKRALHALRERGLVETVRVGKRDFWRRTDKATVTKVLQTGMSVLGLSTHPNGKHSMITLQGVAELSRALTNLIDSLPYSGELCGIQPTQSALISTEKLTLESVIAINEQVKKRKLIIRGVIGEKYPETLSRVFGEKWLASFIGRTAHLVMVPERYLNYDAELYLTRKHALIVDWKNETGISIDDSQVLALLTSQYQFMHDMGERITHEQFTSLLSK